MKTHEVTHTTQYEFSKAVYLEPHLLRLLPTPGRGQRLLNFSMHISPKPVTQFVTTDIGGNASCSASFGELTDFLQIETRFEFEHDPADNPYGYVVYPFGCGTLPMSYPIDMRAELDTYAKADCRSHYVDGFARQLAETTNLNTVMFLSMLAQCICDTVKHTHREEGGPMPPEQTLREQRGSCRDLAALYLEACRCLGLAGRFVSGYVLRENEETAHHLHAWAQIFVPGAGWMGFDPALGLACDATYVVAGVARNPADAAPVSGTYRGGENVNCSLSYNVDIRKIPAKKKMATAV